MRARTLLTGAALTAALWLVLLGLDRALTHRLATRAETAAPTGRHAEGAVVEAGDADVEPVRHAAAPIAVEALVFRTAPGSAASDPRGRRRDEAHPRTLATFRRLRAYPGAPPRVPHGLTADEFRGSTCNTCHERGGWSPRFGAYVPLTPHPEWIGCLQCHATDGAVMGEALPLPGTGMGALCNQCHAAARGRAPLPELDWQPGAWPTVRGSSAYGPPEIPHDLQLRGNCLACHMAPGAVAELRTTHPERANCRQCHVAPDELAFSTADPPRAGRSP